jgi:sugar phosphate isomerase/epimerase
MELGVSASKKPVEELLLIAKMAKVFNIELDLSLPGSNLESFTDERINNIVRLANKYGASISLRLPSTLNLAEPLEILKHATILYAAECIMLGKKLGAKLVSLSLGYYKNSIDKDLAINLAINTIRSIAVFARKEKILLAVENAKYLSKDSEFSYLGDNRTLKFFH